MVAQQVHPITQPVAREHESVTASQRLSGVLDGCRIVLGLEKQRRRLATVLYADVVDYTRLTEERGDQAAAGLAEDLVRTVQRTAVDHGGKVVKWLGDGVMFRFPEPGRGVLAALEMVAHVDDIGPLPAHVGLHAGPVLFQQGDYFGRTVNAASRIADYARPGEVLVSQEVVDACTEAGVAFDEVGPVDLKGFSGALHLYVAHRLD